jgi:uncharacterized cysteine cluster protein YcgN (CxxCxxCC family)
MDCCQCWVDQGRNLIKMRKYFWKTLTLEQLDAEEWEALCDRCNLCCHHRMLDQDTKKLTYLNSCCSYLNLAQGGCTDYANRSTNVPICTPLTIEKLQEPEWLPVTCAYRLRAEGKDLLPWHPLNLKIVYLTQK